MKVGSISTPPPRSQPVFSTATGNQNGRERRIGQAPLRLEKEINKETLPSLSLFLYVCVCACDCTRVFPTHLLSCRESVDISTPFLFVSIFMSYFSLFVLIGRVGGDVRIEKSSISSFLLLLKNTSLWVF